MHQLNLERPLAFFDLETTGINLTRDRIIQISILKALPGGEKTQRTWLLNPGIPIPQESSAVHGLTDRDVAFEPTFSELAEELAMYLDDCDLAGFNILRFDVPLLIEEFYRNGKPFEMAGRKIVDAQRIFHQMEPRTLSAAYKFYTGEPMSALGSAHSADTDTLATFHVLNSQLERYVGTELETEEGVLVPSPVKNDLNSLHELSMGRTVDLAGKLYYNDAKQVVFAFGKYKDMTVFEVFSKKEPSYYSWIMGNDFPQDTKSWVNSIWREVQAKKA